MIDMILDLIFPQRACCLCRSPGFYWSRHPWCSECEKGLQELRTKHKICPKCGKFLLEDEPMCRECRMADPPFAIARAVGPYEGAHRQVVKQFKFLEKKKLVRRMACLMAEVVLKEPAYWPLDAVVPVPVSQEGLKTRGFNQSELLAAKIARIIKVSFEPAVLIRVKATPPQRELSRELREQNLRHAFAVGDHSRVRGKNILLVDDVYTTGSTVRECTRTLYEAGALKVSVIVWAAGKGF